MKKIIAVLSVIFTFLFIPVSAEARQGCCSSHGGVCGCSCCDGTSLSSTCRPYYPECSGGAPAVQQIVVQPTRTPTQRPVATRTPTRVPTKVPTLIPTVKPTSTPIVTATLTPTETIAPSPTTELKVETVAAPAQKTTQNEGGFFGFIKWLFRKR